MVRQRLTLEIVRVHELAETEGEPSQSAPAIAVQIQPELYV